VSIPSVLFLVALILALVDEGRARAQSLTGWAVVLVCIGLLWGFFKL
jgi:hypothetical protein